MKSVKSCILWIKQKKLLKSIQKYNEFNKVIKENGYYIYEFEKQIVINMRKHKSEVTLKNVEKIKNYFMKEIDQNELMSKKQKDFYNCKLY